MYNEVDRDVNVQLWDLRPKPDGGHLPGERVPGLRNAGAQLRGCDRRKREDILYATPEGTDRFDGGMTTGNTSRSWGRRMVGRTLAPEDARPDAPPVFVMSHSFGWAFRRDPACRQQLTEWAPTTLIGIMPRDRQAGRELWLPVRLDPWIRRNGSSCPGAARAGRHARDAEAEMNVIAQRVAKSIDAVPTRFSCGWSTSSTACRLVPRTLYTMAAWSRCCC